MDAGNRYYIQLQDCFKAKSSADEVLFAAVVAEEYRDSMPPQVLIARFCNNAQFIEGYHMTTLVDELKRDLEDFEDDLDMDEWAYDTDAHPFKFYLLQRVAESFNI